jgi:hypothetical protein
MSMALYSDVVQSTLSHCQVKFEIHVRPAVLQGSDGAMRGRCEVMRGRCETARLE